MTPDAGHAGSSVAGTYAEYDRALRLRYSKIGCVLSLVLMPAGASLDFFVYPGLLGSFFAIRAVCDLATALVLALHFTDFGERHIGWLGRLWALLPQAAIAWMIYASEGASSPYYAGLDLVIIGMVVPLLWTLTDALILAGATLGLYLAACLAHPDGIPSGPVAFNNFYFLLLPNLICVTLSFVDRQRRTNELRLRHRVEFQNQELALSYDRLAELDRLKSQFFANLSHELRTPLTLIVAPLDDLLRTHRDLPPAVAQALEMTRRNSLRLLKLINDLLELVRLEESRTPITLDPLDLAAFVPGLVESIRHLAQAKGLTLTSAGPAEGVVVDADPERLEKVFLNLLTNAIKFTPPGGSIHTSWERAGRTAVVQVTDTGIGIAANDLPHVFDRFRQADGSSTRRFHGLGIGLSLAKELALEHQGTLSVRSEIGRGTTFRVELSLSARGVERAARVEAELDPILRIAREADRSPDVEIAPTDAGAVDCETARFTVLVVEDEPDIRRFLRSALSPEHRVLEAADGNAGLERARAEAPDLVLLDLMLPGIDGLEVCRRLRENDPTHRTKIVLLTARADEGAKISALAGGCDDFLAKPFSTLELKTRIANLLRASRLEDDLDRRNRTLEDALSRLRETEAQLVQSEKMNAIGSLAAGLLHEIGNPLNFTLTALEVARLRVPEPRAEILEILDDIGEGMKRIRDIVSDLRAFARPAAEGLRERFALAEVVKVALQLTAHEVSGTAVELDLEGGAPVLGSRTQVTHLVMNLVANAARACRQVAAERRGEIRIASARRERRLAVRVRDNGCGIEPRLLDRVFDPFVTTRDVGEGMGLGLSICHTIVRNHGGEIGIRSELGRWTEVAFDLPLDRPEDTTHDSASH